MRWLPLALALPLLAQHPQIGLVPVTSGFIGPTDVQNARDGTGRLFIVQQDGIVRILRNGALLPQPFL